MRSTASAGHLAALSALLLAAVLANPTGPAAPAAAQTPTIITDPVPAPGAVIAEDTVTVALTVRPPDAVVEVRLDGERLVHAVEGADGRRVTRPAVVAAGGHEVVVAVDGMQVRRWTFDRSPLDVRRLAGAARDATAVAVHDELDDTAGGLVVVNADTVADAFAAGPHAATTGRAVVLSTADALLPATAALIDRRLQQDGRIDVTVLGGDAAVSTTVRSALTDAGADVTVLSGPTRYATAAAVALAMADGGAPSEVVVAPGDDWRTTLPASALAAARGAPLLLAQAGLLPQETADVLRVLRGDLRTVTVVGAALGDTDVPAAIADLVPDATVQVIDGRRSGAPDDAGAVAAAVAALIPGGAPVVIGPDGVADALAAAPLAAAGGGMLLAGEAARAQVAADPPGELIVVGGEAVVDPGAVADLLAAPIDGPFAPGVQQVTADVVGGTPQVRVDSTGEIVNAAVHVTLAGQETPGSVVVDDARLTWTAGAVPAEVPRNVPVPLVLVARIAGADHLRHLSRVLQVTLPPAPTTSPEGWAVAGGQGPVVGDGPLRSFSVEVEPATGLDLQHVAAIVEEILLDPRGWTARGDRSLQRVGSSGAADIRVVVATPGTVDYRCGLVGLGTAGRLSCWDGRRAMLNLDRWLTGVSPHHTDLSVYRPYLVSHEFGHGLGFGHVGCPAPGALAPVMMQQSKGLGACVANGWPYPNG